MSEPYAAAQRPADQTETASWLRRIGALLIDWIASSAVAAFILQAFYSTSHDLLTPVIFLLESAVGIALAGSSFGQVVLKIQVRHPDGRPLTLLGALLRQLLVCLVIPPLVFRPDGRGLHDMWTDSGAYPKA